MTSAVLKNSSPKGDAFSLLGVMRLFVAYPRTATLGPERVDCPVPRTVPGFIAFTN